MAEENDEKLGGFQLTEDRPKRGTCRYCGRHAVIPCRNTRDMDPVDGLNRDVTCNAVLMRLGGGERGFVEPNPKR